MNTTNLNSAEIHLYNYLKEQGYKLRIGQIRDFDLFGDETTNEIEGYADEFISDIDPDTDVEMTERMQDEYNDRNSWAIRQSEMIEQFRNEY